jgi:hypothetical protein
MTSESAESLAFYYTEPAEGTHRMPNQDVSEFRDKV